MYDEVHDSMTPRNFPITKDLHQSPNQSGSAHFTSLLHQLQKHNGISKFIIFPKGHDHNSSYMVAFYTK